MSNPNASSSNSGSKTNLTAKVVGMSGVHAFVSRPGNGKASDFDTVATHFTLQFVFDALVRWWKVVVPSSVLLLAVSIGIVYLTFRPTYQAAAWLRIYDTTPYVAFQSREDSRRFLETQMELIRSPMVLGPVVSLPEIAQVPEIKQQDSPIIWLATQIKAVCVGQSELVKITFDAQDAVAAAKVVNAVVDTYLNFRDRNDSEQTQRVIKLLEEEKLRRMREVDAMRETIRELAKQAAGKDPFAANSQRDLKGAHPLAELQVRLVNAEVERQILEVRVQAFEESIAKEQVEVSEARIDEAIDKNVNVSALHAALQEKKSRLQEYSSILLRGNKDPAYVSLQEQIVRSEENLQKVREDLRAGIRSELTERLKSERQNELTKLRNVLETARLTERLLHEREQILVKNTKEATGDTLQVEFRQTELARAEEVLTRIADRVVKLRTEQNAPARVEEVAKASPPPVPVELVPYKRMVTAGLGGLCLPLLLVVSWEWFARRVRNSEQLELYTRLPVLGEIARLPVRCSPTHSSSPHHMERDLGLFEESIDSLRTCMVLSEPLHNSQILAITSASSSEGKTSIALQLAVSIARASGQRVLLIDADMRSPDIHRLLQMRREPGLAEVLSHKCSVEDAIVTDWSDFVHVMPAGKLTVSPHKLVGNGAVKALLDAVRPQYRHIVIDTPPILPASEALILARAADACLFCTMRNVSRIDRVRRSSERLVATGAKPMGAVLCGVSSREYAHHYGSYYGYAHREATDD